MRCPEKQNAFHYLLELGKIDQSLELSVANCHFFFTTMVYLFDDDSTIIVTDKDNIPLTALWPG
jgi:hypothetical protein